MGDYDDRTPLRLAACCGNTAVLEYLLKQDTVLVNAVDRFGGTPYQDAIRHDRKGAAALLEEAGCVRPGDGESHEVIQKMIELGTDPRSSPTVCKKVPRLCEEGAFAAFRGTGPQ